jgi:hypothetical protein
MKSKNCLSEQDLILHYYNEISECSEQGRHVTNCPFCRERMTALSNDLAELPELSYETDPVTGARMAARVTERLNGKRRNWTPAFGASAVAALALVVIISTWSTHEQSAQSTANKTQMTTINLSEDMPDIDFLEDLDLLKEFELLSQLEGV